jgi:hypothetical protein
MKALILLVLSAVCLRVSAQDPTAVLEGQIADQTGGAISGAQVSATNLKTGFVQKQVTGAGGTFAFLSLPAGEYELTAEKESFAAFSRKPLVLSVNQTMRLDVALQLAESREVLQIEDQAVLVQTSSNVLGSVVSRREVVDLPLNGRNFAQLGLLQLGVVPMTAGLAEQGGSRRSGHGYVVNGQRPESNNYLVDGTRVVNRVDGGFALKPPIDAIEEFKILTHTAPPEYGGTSGSNTSIVMRSGSNELHGTIYEFLRNDKLDTRNFFAAETEPLKQNQFGGTIGGPIRHNRLFFSGYYEGFRNRQGITRGSTVPTPQQREGDFSASSTPLIDTTTGQVYPGNRLPQSAISPISQNLLKYYPLGNVTPSFYSSTQPMSNDADQAGAKLDWTIAASDTVAARYAFSKGMNVNPFSILGADVPGFPVQDNLQTQLFNVTESHIMGTSINTFRFAFFRHYFLLENRLSGLSPRALGFDYDSTYAAAAGAPFFIVNGYSNMGDPAIGPRNTTQSDFTFSDSAGHASAAHSLKIGGEFRRTRLNSIQGHYSNGAFNFTSSPLNYPFANFLSGRTSTFTQAGGDFARDMWSWDFAAYAQDEWRATRALTLNFGLRYEINTPFSEKDGKLNAFAPGRQSVVNPKAPPGVLFPGDPGVPDTIAPIYYKGLMPRVGLAWDVSGNGKTVIRSGYAIFYDNLANGVGGPLRVATQALPWAVIRQASGSNVDFSHPLGTATNLFQPGTFTSPMNMFTIQNNLRPPYAQDWNFAIQRTLGSQVLEVRYVGTKGTRLPRFVEGDPAVYAPGATAANANRRRIYAGCPVDPAVPCTLGYAALVDGSTNSTYHAAQVSLSRQFTSGAGYAASYTFAKALDYVSSLHIAGPAPILVSGEMDLAQNPFNLAAEHGPSLFDARQRLVVHGMYETPWFRDSSGLLHALFSGWQLNGIASFSSATPFTVYDSRNVALQAAIPPVAGTFASRPDLASDPNQGPHTAQQWISAAAFRRLNAVTEAGQFGNEGRNVCRGNGIANLDVSVVRNFPLTERASLQFRAESFNVMNHPNLGLPVNDLVSPNFGRILEAGPPRLMQLGLKMIF